ncbi:MAG TPA: glycosyltransferase [Micropepsaceae bacterium]|jgi:glycosyltransferase involved in cell wall biosynthesis|nr:glycosyltransferase [Micropepsaceae bacterium]
MALKVLTVLAGASVGGAETFFVTLTIALARGGIAVRSVLKPNPLREQALKQAGIAYKTAPFGGVFDFTTKRALARAAEAFAPDIVIAFAGRAASFVPRGRYTVIGRLGGYYNLKNFKSCDYLVCNAPDLVRYVVAGGWPEAKVFLIPNFAAVPGEPALDRAVFGTPKEAPLAVALGRLHPNKGLDILIRAAARMPELFVWIAGEGPERSALEKLARELGVAGRIRFLGWRTDRGALYKSADVCVYPSREEPFGNVVVEAWSCGVPIVTTASTGPAWLAHSGEDAIVTPIDDVAALADAIRSVVTSRPLAARLVAAGKRRVIEEFSEAAIVARYRDLFEKVRR